MKTSELIAAVGDDNVRIQNLDVCADKMDYSAKQGVTTIVFGVDQPLTPEGTQMLGLVVWMPRDKVASALSKSNQERK